MNRSDMDKSRTRTVKIASVAYAAALLILAWASPGHAGDTLGMRVEASAEALLMCDSRTKIIADLKQGYAEQPIALGVTSAGTVMELWTAAEGNTWTLIVTLNDGNSCVVGAGDSWTNIGETAAGLVL